MAAAADSTKDGADLISGLPDGVLLHILELLPDAGDAACTGVLSRRWRGLWTRLAALRFDSGSDRPEFSSEVHGSQRFVAMVNDALALRAAAQTEPAFQHLAISFTMKGILLPEFFKAARGWIQDAVRNEVRSLVLELDQPSLYKYYASLFATSSFFAATNKGNKKKELFVVALEDLPSSSKMETMRLALYGATVRLPAAATFAALVDLSLENMEFLRGHGQSLNHLLSSSCCPCLRKISLRELVFNGLDELFVASETLLELSMEKIVMWESDILRLRTPSLRVLRVVPCGLDELVLSAPRLEELQFGDSQPFSKIDIDGELPCVRNLKVQLTTHAYLLDDDVLEVDDEDMNAVCIRLLSSCTSATCLDVDLYITEKEEQGIDIMKGRIPWLPQVTSLTVHVFLFELHSFGAGMADILRQCSNLKYLRVHCTFEKCDNLKPHFLCDHPDHWKSHEVTLPRLREAKFKGLVGTECELWFIQSMLTSTTQLQKVTINFDPEYSLITNRTNAFKHIRPLRGGMWTCHEAYLCLEWKPCL